MPYEVAPFGDIFLFHNGKAIKAVETGDYPVYGSNGIIGYTNTHLYSNAIILGRVGAYCGSVMQCEGRFWPSDNTLVVDVNEENDDIKFCYYMLQTLHLNNYAGGSAQPLITQTILKKLICPRPPLDRQRQIAKYLSAYDSLIENNQKQIKLLEEAAQRLYKEWFVDLRFPGYEDTPIIDGMPEGWVNGTLGDIATFVRGKTITKAQVHYGNVPVVAGGLEPAYYHNRANTVAPVITVSGSGANAGFARLYNVDVFASDCSFVDSKTTPYLFYVYSYLKANKSSLDSLQKGSAQPHVYPKDLNAMKLKVPTDKYLGAFCRLVAPYFERIKTLQKEIVVSAEARDRLLPKLMSGEIEI